jgi:hypothetical protein
MYESDVLVADYLDLIDQPEPAEVVPQLFFSGVLVQTTKIYVSTGVALADREAHLRTDGRRLSPSDLELLTMKGELLDGGICVERRSGCTVKEGQENA